MRDEPPHLESSTAGRPASMHPMAASLLAPHFMNRTLLDYYRCPEEFVRCSLQGELAPDTGYFRFGTDAICHGALTKGRGCHAVTEELYDVLSDASVQPGTVGLSFDPEQTVQDLRLERYCSSSQKEGLLAGTYARRLYYMARPLLGVGVRRHLQKLTLKGWNSIPFPRWPVDTTVERIHETLLRLCLQANQGVEIPFIWFWPEGYSSCVVVTHDVETSKGLEFCSDLMDLDDSFGVKSSFQLIPENRYSIGESLAERIRSRGFELNIHDLNHDGKLFASETQFMQRAHRINEYARAFGARGFRSAVLYRNPAWYGALDFRYEMSIPNVAHLDPQRGGCCTVMPYFIGKLVELPLTTTQDYSLFNILNDYTITLWRQQLDIIGKSHGMATFNIHPDYIIAPKARAIYVQLLRHIAGLLAQGKVWLTLPGEVDQWWRNRAKMHIVRRNGRWTIQGPNSQRARVAYARMRDDKLEYAWTGIDQEQALPSAV